MFLNQFNVLLQEIIGGRHLTEYFSSLYIVKTSLVSLNMRSLKEIRSGTVAILENKDLCYAPNIDWKQVMKSSSHNTLLDNNRMPENCILESEICDPQCSSYGCWGPGKGMCLSCKNFVVESECVGSCDPNLGLYKASELECMKCHPECNLTCSGKILYYFSKGLFLNIFCECLIENDAFGDNFLLLFLPKIVFL